MIPRVFLGGCLLTVVFALIAGLLTVGGPDTGRRERFDNLRYQDLAHITRVLRCQNWRIRSPELPERLTVESLRSYCGGAEIAENHLTDNETGRPYQYRKTGQEFAVCAEFYDAGNTRKRQPTGMLGSSFNPDTGCVSGRI